MLTHLKITQNMCLSLNNILRITLRTSDKKNSTTQNFNLVRNHRRLPNYAAKLPGTKINARP